MVCVTATTRGTGSIVLEGSRGHGPRLTPRSNQEERTSSHSPLTTRLSRTPGIAFFGFDRWGKGNHFLSSLRRFSLLRIPRSLHILLFDAERAWAYAMQLKEETVNDPRKRDHMVRRMKKAADLASKLEELSKTFCDQRTAEDAHVQTWIRFCITFFLVKLGLKFFFCRGCSRECRHR